MTNIENQFKTPEQINKEQEEKIKKIFELIAKLKEKDEKENIHRNIENSNITTASAETISKRLKEMNDLMIGLEIQGEKREAITKLITEYQIIDHEAMAKDDKFPINNFNYLRSELVSAIDEVLQKTEKVEQIEKVSVIFFDLDGLKSINDNLGYNAGDNYLKKVSEILTKGKTTAWLKSIEVTVKPCHRSGDEFIVGLVGKDSLLGKNFTGIDGEAVKNISLEEYILKIYKEEISSMDTKEFVDFSQEEIRNKFFEITNWPEDFQFQANASGGVINLKQAILTLESEDVNNYRELLEKLKGSLLHVSSEGMQSDKKREKKKRTNGTESEQTLEKIYRASRGVSEEKLIEENKRLKKLLNLPE